MNLKGLLKELRLKYYSLETFWDNIKVTVSNLKAVKGTVAASSLDLFSLAFLLGVSALLFKINYKPGTWLVGWDSLNPELNFSAAWLRSVYSTWQEYRGLGLFDGMAHAANLVHTLYLWILNLFLPPDTQRYIFLFLMHFLGGAGVYFLITRIFLKETFARRAIGIIASLFYLLNLATIQMFYSPFEVFLVHFAFFPWIALALSNYLENPTRKNLLIFGVLNILALPQAFVPTVFIVYLILIFSFLLFALISDFKAALSRSMLAILTIFCINAYWLFPYLFSLPQNAGVITEAKINQMSSQDVFLHNKARGNLWDLVLLRGSMLDMKEFTKDGNSTYIMKGWREYTQSPLFVALGLVFFSFPVGGLVRSLKNRQKKTYPFILAGTLGFFFLGTSILGVGALNNFLRANFPILAEAYRFSFTKFSTLYILCYTVFFSIGVAQVFKSFQQHSQKFILAGEVFFLIIFLLLVYSYPAFKGDFLYPELKVEIPKEYFRTVDFFMSQSKSTRLAIFPQPDFWSWRFNRWGYRGSGFLWQGIEQPMLDRAFDPWSDKDENYYWEISYALYSGNRDLFEKVLEKYQINWILVDESVINPSSPKALYLTEVYNLLSDTSKFTKEREFGFLKIYKVDLENDPNNFVFLTSSLPEVEPTSKWNNKDQAFSDNGNYTSKVINYKLQIINGDIDFYYPFRSVFTNKSQKDLEFNIEDKGEYYLFSNGLQKDFSGYNLVDPQTERELVRIDPSNFSHVDYLTYETYFDGQKVEVKVPKVGGYYSAEINPAGDQEIKKHFQETIKECNSQKDKVKAKNQVIKSNNQTFLRLIAEDANNCSTSFYLPDLSHKYAYLIEVRARNKSGKSLLFWLENLNIKKADLETYLPQSDQWKTYYFIQPPMGDDGMGYSLHFDNISIGRDESVNDLAAITVNPIPYRYLTKVKLVGQNTQATSGEVLGNLEVEHPNPSYYSIQLSNVPVLQRSTLVLSQAYNPGWKAYWAKGNFLFSIFYFLFQPVGEHVLVNNWENGWLLDPTSPRLRGASSDERIVIVFLPQYLEYLGFLLAGGFIITVIFWRKEDD